MYTFISGWLLGHPSEKYEFVNWDDGIPSGKMKHIPSHQPDMHIHTYIHNPSG